MECYEGATMIKTFRGLMADGAQDTINLHTNNGKTGYRIVKFQLMGRTPGSMTIEAVVKIYTKLQSTIDHTVDFSDPTLLGAGYYIDNSSVVYGQWETVIFDNQIFNQDIFITHLDNSGGEFINYYIELEQISLDLNEATVATLQSIRSA